MSSIRVSCDSVVIIHRKLSLTQKEIQGKA